MALDSHSGLQSVREALKERGFEPEVVELERTARNAAEVLGVRVEQIRQVARVSGEANRPPRPR